MTQDRDGNGVWVVKVRTVQGTWVPIGVLRLAHDPNACIPTCKALVTMAGPKGRRGSCLGTSSLRMSLRRNPRRIPFTPAVAIDEKDRRDREAGTMYFGRAIGRAGYREGDIGDARGDGAVHCKAAGRLTSFI
jgi:hypothetical protein